MMNKFRIDRAIGKGATGTVVSATQLKNNEEVAIKHLRVDFSNYYSLKKLVREIKIHKFLSKGAPELFPVLKKIKLGRMEEGTTERDVFIVMEKGVCDVSQLLDKA